MDTPVICNERQEKRGFADDSLDLHVYRCANSNPNAA